MAGEICVKCQCQTETGQKRYTVTAKVTKTKATVSYALDKLCGIRVDHGYICNKCMYLLSKEFTRIAALVTPIKTPVRKRVLSTPAKGLTPKRKKLSVSPKIRSFSMSDKPSYIPSVVQQLKGGHIKRALNKLFTHSSKARKELASIVKEFVRKEITEFTRKHAFPDLSKESLQSFSWLSLLTNIQKEMPILYQSLLGALTTKNKEFTATRLVSVQ